MITQHAWMFLSSFEKLREKILKEKTITNLMHMENMVMGIAFGTAVTVFQNAVVQGYKGTYNHIKLQDIENAEPKEFPVQGNRFAQVSAANFSKIPGSPIAYWAGENFISVFEKGVLIGNIFPVKKGMDTSDNDRFLRFWYEISSKKFSFGHLASNCKWYPYDKGGNFRRWYGNKEYIVNYENNGYELVHSTANLRSRQLYFKEHITWSALTASYTSFRYSDYKSIFDSAGSSMFPDSNQIYYVLALMNTRVFDLIMSIINPTINYGAGSMSLVPLVYEENTQTHKLVSNNIDISRSDWDSYETSWDFKRHPMV